MHLDGQHPMYPYTEEEKQEIRKELGLKEGIIEEDIDAILEWYYKQPHLSHVVLNRDFVERVLVFARGSREKAKRRIDNFFKYRSYSPEIVQGRHRELSDDYDMWSFYRQVALPKLYEGKRISVLKFTEPDPNKFSTDVMFRNTILLGDVRLKHDYMLGDIWVLDLANTSIAHLLRLNPIIVQKSTQIFQEGMGVRVFGIHILHAPSYGHHLVNFMKQFMKPKIMERVKLHKSLEELHKHLPKRYLPAEYGGEQPSTEELSAKCTRELRKEPLKSYILECSKQISDESKRPGDKYNEEYLVGSFKKLDFD